MNGELFRSIDIGWMIYTNRLSYPNISDKLIKINPVDPDSYYCRGYNN